MFQISGTQLQTNTTLDYETRTSYDIYINVNDGTNDFAKNFTITVNDVAEGTSSSSGGGGSRSRDYCPDGDFTDSKYDRDCGINPDETEEENITGTGEIDGNSEETGTGEIDGEKKDGNNDNSKYIPENTKIKKVAGKLDSIITKKYKENSKDALELRNQLLKELEKYINANKDERKELKKGILVIYKKLLEELKFKKYLSSNKKVENLSKRLDKGIAKKIKDTNHIVWQYRNNLLKLLDNLLMNAKNLSKEEIKEAKKEIIEVYKKILKEIS